MTVTVRRADTDADLDAVLDLPAHLYHDDPAYVAPLRAIERRRLKPSNPFFEHAELVLFLAERDGEVVGTISALKDDKFQEHHEQRIVWFGYFECIEDPEVAEALFAALEEQARAWDATEIRGPRNLTRMEYIGLTVQGFDRRPPMLQGHHKRYYVDYVRAAGFEKSHDHYAYETPLVDELGHPRPVPDGLRAKADACDIEGLSVRPARWRTMRHDLLAAHEVLNDAWQTVPDVAPIPRGTWMALGRTYLAFLSTELLQIAYVDDEPVGFAVCMPEINNAMAAARGKVLPGGWLRFVLEFSEESTAAFKLIGVKQQWRGEGLHAVLIANIIEGVQRAGFTRIDGSIIDERNKPMRAVVEHAEMEIWRVYRIFRKEL